MAHPGRRGYDNREIVLKYIHYKLSQRGYDWVASGDRAPASPGLSPPAAAALAAAGTSSDHTGLVSPHPEPPGSAAASNAAPGDGLRPAPPVGHLLRRQAGGEFHPDAVTPGDSSQGRPGFGLGCCKHKLRYRSEGARLSSGISVAGPTQALVVRQRRATRRARLDALRRCQKQSLGMTVLKGELTFSSRLSRLGVVTIQQELINV
nr:PREDICTED: apoptosis regulator Bcl-2 [Struthio camelus australis]